MTKEIGMKRTVAMIPVVALLCAPWPGDARSQEKPPAKRGRTTAVLVEKGPAIDGALNDPVWKKCPPLTLGQCTSEKTWPLETTARVLFDATRLYVAFQCAETDTDAIRAGTAERDGDVWKDDSVELFVTGDIRTGYYHFAVNPKGVFMDTRTVGGRKDDKSFNSSADVKASIDKGKGWTVTLAVPLKEVGACVGKGQTWVLNLNRTRPARGGKAMLEWPWAVMASSDYHSVADFGNITGVDIPKRADGVTRQADTPPKLPSYDKGRNQGGVTVYHHLPTQDVPDKGQGTAWALPLKIRLSTGLKVAFLARGTGGVERCPFNMFDKRSNDNTTSYSYRTVTGQWSPVVYYIDRFRYNSNLNRVAGNTDYSNIRFHGNRTDRKGALYLRDFTIYRGEDAAAPAAPTGLMAAADPQGVLLTWKPGEDNVGIGMYVVSRAGKSGKFAKVAQTGLPVYTDTPAAAAAYRYRVLAVDFQDNLSEWSESASVQADKAFEPPKLAGIDADLASDRLAYAEHIRKVHQAGKGKVRKGWVLQFGDSLTGATSYRTECESFLGRYRVEARGRAGWRTGQGRKVIDSDLANANPEFCLILYGTNNSKSAKAIEQAMDDMLYIAKACEKRGTVPIIGTIPPRGFRDPASKPEANYNAALIKMCRANKVPIAYLFEEFQAQPDRRKLLAGDGVHWQGDGFPTTGKVWRKVMDQVGFVLLDRP